MTPEMVAKARTNGRKGGYTRVEFRLGEIEALPVADASVDVIISNCVINLCPDKRPVYREAFRVLRPGGRVAVSDVVAREELPANVRRDLALHSGCLAGATVLADLTQILAETGFTDIVIRPKGNSDEVITSWEAKRGFEFSPNAKFSYDVTKKVALGMEYYGSYGPVTGFDPLRDQQQQFLPAVDIDFGKNWEFNFGVGVGVTQATDHLLVKAILGYRFHNSKSGS